MLKKAQGVLVLKGLAGKWACRICFASFKLKYPSNPLIYHDNTKVDILLWYTCTVMLCSCYLVYMLYVHLVRQMRRSQIWSSEKRSLQRQAIRAPGCSILGFHSYCCACLGLTLQWLSRTDWNSSCCACLHSLHSAELCSGAPFLNSTSGW